ncbi:collagen alpha-1(II) chain-like [Motacilla alba alba]|uniref:collagen alpha-1(II) chain-like n=1 Tax=Motacilla alba alba TaxID=1094192 RepID=UPI0018D4EB79|nr:collagen alpha-1(II) chain-like [Motacilla alba alba]
MVQGHQPRALLLRNRFRGERRSAGERHQRRESRRESRARDSQARESQARESRGRQSQARESQGQEKQGRSDWGGGVGGGGGVRLGAISGGAESPVGSPRPCGYGPSASSAAIRGCHRCDPSASNDAILRCPAAPGVSGRSSVTGILGWRPPRSGGLQWPPGSSGGARPSVGGSSGHRDPRVAAAQFWGAPVATGILGWRPPQCGGLQWPPGSSGGGRPILGGSSGHRDPRVAAAPVWGAPVATGILGWRPPNSGGLQWPPGSSGAAAPGSRPGPGLRSALRRSRSQTGSPLSRRRFIYPAGAPATRPSANGNRETSVGAEQPALHIVRKQRGGVARTQPSDLIGRGEAERSKRGGARRGV